MTLRTLSAIACFVAFPSFAAITPPSQPFDAISWKARSESKPASVLRLGTFLVHFEETTLADVQRTVGAGLIDHQGDAGESIYWLCYTSGNERIWIIADGEMGGSTHAVTGISAQHLPKAKAEADCPSLPRTYRPASLQRGLWLGLTEAEASKILGAPSHLEGAWRSFDFQTKVPGKCGPNGYDLGNWLLIKFNGGRAETLIAGQVTSC